MSVVKGPSALERFVASGHVFRAREAFNAGRDACVAYARAAYKHRGGFILLLLAHEMAEIEMEGKWPVPPDVESDLRLLAKLRAHPGFADFERLAVGGGDGP